MEAEREAVNFGKSLIVPSVQELAKQPLDKIPPRYSQQHFWEPHILSAAMSYLSVPVIDLQRLNTEDSMDSELHKLHSACTDWGFFQVYIYIYMYYVPFYLLSE
ncbi:hypothetical protein FEM48_Zijuj01G0056500 [Ziziphus jujuba var. spinosa]|uniref:Non-haem dioxygenase N-terminal domain-containing protein n=1 Tax=Ziziphus jujuba var. spinosa TaxID=714518 RepID=A0A978VZF7_ZIZJJ|nr:hypothetical protein FEM48_Zijuj01G0056500 [Ziziphus jujuba var. spinosa]